MTRTRTAQPDAATPGVLSYGSWPWLAWGVCLALGVVVGIAGTIAHRSAPPWGVVASLVTLVAVCTVARATAGTGTVLATGIGWMVTVQLLTTTGPGGDVLVPAAVIGYVWAYGGLVAVLLPLLAPRSWFAEVPFGSRAIPRNR